jgi:aryl-phospho-beta-D-glucosidase BglC (GH1 family)
MTFPINLSRGWRTWLQAIGRQPLRITVAAALLPALVACGGGGGGGADSTYSVGGSLAGISGAETVVLQNNGGDDLTLDASYTAKPFAFATKVSAYNVSVKTAPAGKLCTVSHGSGTATADVSNVSVTCAAQASSYTISGSVQGLAAGESVTLQNNGADDTSVRTDNAGNSSFTFSTKVAQGAHWSVSVKTQPSNTKTCVVANGSGTASADVSNVSVTCSAITYTVGGTVSGLNGQVVLTNNGGDDLTLGANGSFSFVTPVAAGGAYNVQVKTSPTLQTCSASSNTGTANGNVSNVQITCATKVISTYSVGGVVVGLDSGKTVTLQNNGGDNLQITSTGAASYVFTFSTSLANGAGYNVSVATNPAGQTCTVFANGSGTINAGNVGSVQINCASTGYAVNGSVSGLLASGLVLQNNGGDDLSISSGATSFGFGQRVAQGVSFLVSVKSQPTGQTCVVNQASGQQSAASGVTVRCANSMTFASGLAWRGLSISGAEWGSRNGPFGWGPFPTQTEADYYKGKGMNILRMDFAWERLQPTLSQALDATELASLKAAVKAGTGNGQTVLLNPHNFARYDGHVIGDPNDTTVSNSAFADFWARLAVAFMDEPLVQFGLMNEPHDMPTAQWASAAQAAVTAIRATGAGHWITLPGNGYTSAWNWFDNQNDQSMPSVNDPLGRMVYEVHQYLDDNGSGAGTECSSTTAGVDRLKAFTAWLKAQKAKAFLAEFAGPNTVTCKAAVQGLLTHLNQNTDVWIGWAWWAGGPWQAGGDGYQNSIEPDNLVAPVTDKPQMGWLLPYLQ